MASIMNLSGLRSEVLSELGNGLPMILGLVGVVLAIGLIIGLLGKFIRVDNYKYEQEECERKKGGGR